MMLGSMTWVYGGAAAAFVLLVLIFKSVVIVGGTEIALLERRYFGAHMPQGRVVALAGEVGIQARTLGPGLHLLIPFLYKARKMRLHRHRRGRSRPARIHRRRRRCRRARSSPRSWRVTTPSRTARLSSRTAARRARRSRSSLRAPTASTPSCSTSRKAKAIVIDKGKRGPRHLHGRPAHPPRTAAGPARGGPRQLRGRPGVPEQAAARKAPRSTSSCPAPTASTPTSSTWRSWTPRSSPPRRSGWSRPWTASRCPRRSTWPSPYPATTISRTPRRFLENGGQRGPQFDVLKPGTYYVNPLFFKVELDDVAVVERGQVAVVVSNVGEEPAAGPPDGRGDGQARAAEGRQGARTTTSRSAWTRASSAMSSPRASAASSRRWPGPGFYYLNRRAYMVYIVDTTNITIDWDDSKETRFDPLRGHLPRRLRDQRLGEGRHPRAARPGPLHGGQDRLHREPHPPRHPPHDRLQLPQPGLLHLGHELHAGPAGGAAQGRGPGPGGAGEVPRGVRVGPHLPDQPAPGPHGHADQEDHRPAAAGHVPGPAEGRADAHRHGEDPRRGGPAEEPGGGRDRREDRRAEQVRRPSASPRARRRASG